MIDKYRAIANEKAAYRLIAPVSNLFGTPVFVHTGMKDDVVPPINQKVQAGFFKSYNANVYHMFDPEIGHYFGEDVPRRIITYLYENIENSGISAGDPSKGAEEKWYESTHGIFNAFLQQPVLDAALDTPKTVEEAGLGKWGFVYYPNACVSKDTPK